MKVRADEMDGENRVGERRGVGREPLPLRQVPKGRPVGRSWGDLVDRVLAAVLLVAVAPLMALVAIAVKLESPKGPIFYKQERVGLNRRRLVGGVRFSDQDPEPSQKDRRRSHGEGKPFEIWKFRSMVADAESRSGPVWASENDPRITRVGRFLRLTRLDELPQLINVLRGEMRLVGPRPERPHFVGQLAEKVPGYRHRLTVPPGITGLAQVEREYDADMDDVRKKLGYDLFYIENRRPSMDFKILFKTVGVVIRRRGAR